MEQSQNIGRIDWIRAELLKTWAAQYSMITADNSIWSMIQPPSLLYQKTIQYYRQELLRVFTVMRTNFSVKMKRWDVSHIRRRRKNPDIENLNNLIRWTQSSLSRNGTESQRLASLGQSVVTAGGICCISFVFVFVF